MSAADISGDVLLSCCSAILQGLGAAKINTKRKLEAEIAAKQQASRQNLQILHCVQHHRNPLQQHAGKQSVLPDCVQEMVQLP